MTAKELAEKIIAIVRSNGDPRSKIEEIHSHCEAANVPDVPPSPPAVS